MILEVLATCWLVAGQPTPIRGTFPPGWEPYRYGWVMIEGREAVVLRRFVRSGERVEAPPGCRPLPESVRR